MKLRRRAFIGGGAAALGCGWTTFAAIPSREGAVRPEDFGAKGDGVSNDTDAFAAMSAHINRSGGGTIELRKTTYLVGRQTPVTGPRPWSFEPAEIMQIRDLIDALVIRGNGARLKCAPGLRFGTFDRATGKPVE